MTKNSDNRRLILHPEKCISCAGCVGLCPELALDMFEVDLHIYRSKCNFCMLCLRICPMGALSIEKV